ncbi:unnamed protein product [Auanema sp. JU1783]|nr:unnamed protein product [Auanema sp. JU1783]
MGLQAIELLAISLAVAIFFALLLIILNCVTSCYQNCRTSRRKSDVEKLPDDYVNEIHRLLDRHKKVMNNIEIHEEYQRLSDEPPLSPITESMVGTPVRVRSRSNSVKLQKLKDELEEYRIDKDDIKCGDKDECEDRRRTWGGLNDSIFDPIDLPNSSDAQVQTTGTLQRMSTPAVMKIETTV